MSLRTLSLRSLRASAFPSMSARCATQASRRAGLGAVARTYATTSDAADHEAELARVLETARRNVEKGIRAPKGDDSCVRMAAFGKPGSGKVGYLLGHC